MPKQTKRMIELLVSPIVYMETGERVAFRSQMRINDDKLGPLLPQTYTHIADKLVLSKQLFTWAFEEAILVMKNLIRREIDFDFLSLYAPEKLFEDTEAVEKLMADITESGLEFKQFALEVYPDFLLEQESIPFANAQKLRQKGVRIILLNFASENFPIARVSSIPADIFCIDDFLVSCINGDENEQEYALGIIKIAKNMKKQILCDKVNSQKDAEKLEQYIDLGCGNYFGKYINNKHIKVRWLEKH